MEQTLGLLHWFYYAKNLAPTARVPLFLTPCLAEPNLQHWLSLRQYGVQFKSSETSGGRKINPNIKMPTVCGVPGLVKGCLCFLSHWYEKMT